MTVRLNHTIVRVRDKQESAQFLVDLLGLDQSTTYGPFLVVQLGNDVSLDFADDHGPAHPQHYAFLVSETEFDQIFGRIRDRHLPYWGIRASGGRESTTLTTGAEACTGKTPAATSWRSSPAPTEADPASPPLQPNQGALLPPRPDRPLSKIPLRNDLAPRTARLAVPYEAAP